MAAKKIARKHYVVVGTWDPEDNGIREVEDYDCEIYNNIEDAKQRATENGDGWIVAEVLLIAKAPEKPVVEFVPYA